MTMPIDDTLRANADGTAIAVKAKGLAGSPPGRIWFDLARTWAVIVAAVAVFAWAPSFLVFVVCFVVVAAQQYALLILMHDGQHSLLHRRREINNLISKWLIGAPCGTPFFSSQKQHLTHHRTLGSSTEDPAFQFYCYGEPSPKATRRRSGDALREGDPGQPLHLFAQRQGNDRRAREEVARRQAS